MRKIFTLLAALAVVCSCYAAHLSPQQALNRATESSKVAKSLGGKSSSPRLVFTGEMTDGQPALYVFTNASATLFVSADDMVKPLLGYSDSGEFDADNMAPQLKWWLEQYSRQIDWAVHKVSTDVDPVAATPDVDKASRAMAAIAPMIATKWDQTTPYNNYCPTKSGTRTVTGCVATSMAQVMKYFEWPQTQVASISYTWNSQTLTSPAVTFDWANMRNSYSGSYTTTQANAVARLMQVAGYSVEMDYNTSANGGSGAVSAYIRGALVNNFGYDVACDYAYRDYYDTDEWEQMIYDNLANVGPVLYDGTGTNGGHSFVCDGYDGNGSFHFNWGWSGSSDGYFVLTALNPGSLGTGGGAGGFNYDQGAVLGIQPPQSASVEPDPYIACSAELTGSVSSRVLTLKTVTSGGFYNYGVVAGTFDYGLKLENTSTGAVSYIASSNVSNRSLDMFYGFASYNVTIPTTQAKGSYKAYPVYRLNSGLWQPMKLVKGTTEYLALTVATSGITIDNAVTGEISLTSWRTVTGFTSEEAFEGYLTVSNTYAEAKAVSFDAYLCKIESNQYVIYESLGTGSGTIPANSEAEIKFAGTLGVIEADTYYLVFAQDGSVVARLQVEVTSKGSLVVDGFTVNPSVIVPGSVSNVDVEVSSSYSESKTAQLGLFLCQQTDDGISALVNYGAKSVTIAANSSVTLSYSKVIPTTVADGNYYIVLAYSDTGVIIDAMAVEVNSGLSAIETITADDTLEAGRLFNLQGVELKSGSAAPGVYIRLNGDKAEKILVK